MLALKAKAKIVLGLFSLALVAGLFFVFNGEPAGNSALKNSKAVVYKSSSCGCCGLYSSYLEKKGFDVEIINLDDTSPVKAEHNIPGNMESCHTVVVGNYFVEGHVPIEAINKLFAEQPDIDGIALPGMPSGSPGMPGSKTKDWVIYSISNGQTEEFMVI